MLRYFFDTSVDGDRIADEDGRDLDGIDAARRYAREALADIAKHEVAKGADAIAVTVRDETGTQVYSIELSVRD